MYGDPRFTRDVDLVMELDPGSVARFIGAFGGEDFYVPPRHMRDVAMMLRVSGELADRSALRQWSTRRGVAELLEDARELDPD